MVNPWLFLAGAAAIALPILIHLLNKRKFKIVDWAAMRFLLAAQKQNVRRLKLEQWLLLAVRTISASSSSENVGCAEPSGPQR